MSLACFAHVSIIAANFYW